VNKGAIITYIVDKIKLKQKQVININELLITDGGEPSKGVLRPMVGNQGIWQPESGNGI
jgi:hypothetical protein